MLTFPHYASTTRQAGSAVCAGAPHDKPTRNRNTVEQRLPFFIPFGTRRVLRRRGVRRFRRLASNVRVPTSAEVEAVSFDLRISARPLGVLVCGHAPELKHTTLNDQFRRWLADYVQQAQRRQRYEETVAALRGTLRVGRELSREEMNERRLRRGAKLNVDTLFAGRIRNPFPFDGDRLECFNWEHVEQEGVFDRA